MSEYDPIDVPAFEINECMDGGRANRWISAGYKNGVLTVSEKSFGKTTKMTYSIGKALARLFLGYVGSERSKDDLDFLVKCLLSANSS